VTFCSSVVNCVTIIEIEFCGATFPFWLFQPEQAENWMARGVNLGLH